ncbi:MAG: GIY-YIG nuclease family protein [Phaeodactylibacter sp.]|nr:GIY-YIG nuclease family protein [Phaeodactylibacter sp.]MCB9293605.1 GIY-YIG nuclease family protein [Lewinellaceae bacterium]
MYFVYVLRSEKADRHYYGHTANLEKRLKAHNQGKVRSTKAYSPWRLIYHETFESKSEAIQREMFFKTIQGYKFLKRKGII